MASLNAVFFTVFNAPQWTVLGLLTAWRVPKLAVRGSWLRAMIEGATLGALFMLVFSFGIAYGFYRDGQYHSVGDLVGRFNGNFFALQTLLAMTIFAVWLHEWFRRLRRANQQEAP